MRFSSIKNLLLYLGFSIIAILFILFLNRNFAVNKYLVKLEEENISEEEIAAINDIHRIMAVADDIWPGLEKAEIPIIFYNDNYEFLISNKKLKENWHLIDSTRIKHYNIARRFAEKPQSFGVKVNGTWMGSIATRRKMNKELVENFENHMPAFISRFIPYNLIDINKDYHVVLYIHEAFHAFQGMMNEDKLNDVLTCYQHESSYPFQAVNNLENWNREGALLFEAIDTDESEKIKSIVLEWIETRNNRRIDNDLSAEQIGFEKKLEWLEGLSFYVEIKAHQVAQKLNSLNFNYVKNPKYWQDEMSQLKNTLGELDGDLRFYLSGMAQAEILDKIEPDWKNSIFKDDVFLEDIITTVLND